MTISNSINTKNSLMGFIRTRAACDSRHLITVRRDHDNVSCPTGSKAMRRPRKSRLRNQGSRLKKERNFAAEYQRRIARGIALGRSRSQARGHPTISEAPIKPRPTNSDAKLEQALRSLRETQNLSRSAKGAGVSPQRFRRFLRKKKLARRKGRRWRFTDRRRREVVAITTSGEMRITVAGFNKASLVMQHRAAVRAFLGFPDSGHLQVLKPFEGRSVIDTSGRTHFLETRPNVLLRYAASGPESYQVYKLPS